MDQIRKELIKNNVEGFDLLLKQQEINLTDIIDNDLINDIVYRGNFRILKYLIENNYISKDILLNYYELSLNSDCPPLFSLEGIEYFKNIEILVINNHQFLQHIDEIKHLTNLKVLSLPKNNIQSLEPLRNLTNLTRLRFSNNNISSLEPIKNLTDLEFLDCNFNPVSTLLPLKNLKKLKYLHFSNTPVQYPGGYEGIENKDLYYMESNFSEYLNKKKIEEIQREIRYTTRKKKLKRLKHGTTV